MQQQVLATIGAGAGLSREGPDLVLTLAVPADRAPVASLAGERVDFVGEGNTWHAAALARRERRPVLQVKTTRFEGALAERHLPLEGTQNFRDLGGYRTADGRTVRWGHLYRADSLSALSEADVAWLREIGLRGVLDFRGAEELDEEPGALGSHNGFAYRNRPVGDTVSPAEWRDRFERGELGKLDASWLVKSYVGLLDERGAVFGEVIRWFAQGEDLPAVFHCTAGKDRTGVMSALILSLLGVSRDQVIGDYALTSLYTQDRIRSAERWFSDRGVLQNQARHLMGSPPENMAKALDHLEAAHGGIERYARERMGLDEETIAALRERMLG